MFRSLFSVYIGQVKRPVWGVDGRRRVAYRTEVVEGEQMNRSWAIIAALTSGIALSSPASAQELTPSAINASAEENLTQAQARSSEVKKVMAAVERANDTVAADCVARAMRKVDPLVGVTEQAREKVLEYLATSDIDRALFELRKMDIASAKIDQFAAEAQSCVNEGDAEEGDTRIDMTSEPLADSDDTNAQVSDDSIVGNDAQGTSPFE